MEIITDVTLYHRVPFDPMPFWSTLADVWARAQEPVVLKGLVQGGAAALLALVVVGLARGQRLALEAELSTAFVRGFVQVVAMGLLIGVLLTVPLAWSAVILLGMVGGPPGSPSNGATDCPGSRASRSCRLAWAPGLPSCS